MSTVAERTTTLDSRVPDGLLEKVRLAIDADLMQEIDITES